MSETAYILASVAFIVACVVVVLVGDRVAAWIERRGK